MKNFATEKSAVMKAFVENNADLYVGQTDQYISLHLDAENCQDEYPDSVSLDMHLDGRITFGGCTSGGGDYAIIRTKAIPIELLLTTIELSKKLQKEYNDS